MSRTTFMRHFRDRAGRSSGELLTGIQMSVAANELKKPAVTIKDVADSIAYRSVTAFRRAFANRMGMTPGRWLDVSTEASRTKRVDKTGATLC
jgi:AraC family transcriptional activator of mtrCDE